MDSLTFTNLPLDLRQVKCPLNFVKAKLAMEKLAPGESLVILLDNDLTMDVPQSLRQEGYVVSDSHITTHPELPALYREIIVLKPA